MMKNNRKKTKRKDEKQEMDKNMKSLKDKN